MSKTANGKSTGEDRSFNRDYLTSEQYNEMIVDRIVSKHRNEEKIEAKNSKYGSMKYTDEGIIARIYGEYLVDISTLSKPDKISFEYGYYEAANRQLELLIKDKNVSDFIRSSLYRKTKFKKEEEFGLSVKELLYQIGYRDSYDTNPRIEQASEIIKSNNDYFEGYMTGTEEQKLGKGRK